MIRKLIARSIVVAGLAPIIGLFWYEYGIEALGIGVDPIFFSAEEPPINIADQFKPGPKATVHRVVAVDLHSAGVRALHFSPFNPDTRSGPRHKVYIDEVETTKEVSDDTVLTTAVQPLRLFIKKAGSLTSGEFPYGLTLTDRKLANAGEIIPSDSETLVRAEWTKEEEEGLWTLQVKGVSGSSAKAFIMASDIFPVISKFSPTSPPWWNLLAPKKPLEEPIPMVIYQDGRRTPICLDFTLANQGYHVLPGRSDRFKLAELDLGGDGEKISMKFDVDAFKNSQPSDRVNDSCGYWSKLSDREKLLDRYRKRQLNSLKTVLWAQNEPR